MVKIGMSRFKRLYIPISSFPIIICKWMVVIELSNVMANRKPGLEHPSVKERRSVQQKVERITHAYAGKSSIEAPIFGVRKVMQFPAMMQLMIEMIAMFAMSIDIVPLPSAPHRLVDNTTMRKFKSKMDALANSVFKMFCRYICLQVVIWKYNTFPLKLSKIIR
jgi:hypothetical protein